MTRTSEPALTRTVFHLEITDDHALVLPPELRAQMGVEAGDIVAVSVLGNGGFLHKVPRERLAQPVVTEPVPALKGLLRDYFTDWDDVNRFVQEERGHEGERDKKR